MTEETFKQIGDYEILGVLGVGGMGKVYRVRNVISDRIEAMKILLPDLGGRRELAERFLREIKLLASLNHPNIAELRTALTWDNQLVMIMEYVEGVTLAARLKQGPISPEQAVNYTDQVLAALGYAHRLQIIHRDIKPANMMLTPQGVVKLMDFGIARSKNDPILTAVGSTLGSLQYMSPEQVRGESVDARSDLYSLGVSLYEMATGHLPFEAENDYAIMAAHLQRQPTAPITLRPDMPGVLNDIIMVSLSKDPAERFQSADAFRDTLKTIPLNPAPDSAVQNTAIRNDAVAEATIVDTTPPSAIISAIKSAEVLSPSPVQAQVKTPLPPQPLPTVVPARVPPLGSSPAEAQSPPPEAPPSPISLPQQPPGPMNAPAVSPGTFAGSSHRGLYISLGALIVLVVLVAAGLYVPRSNRVNASHEAPATTQPPTPAKTNSTLSTNAIQGAAVPTGNSNVNPPAVNSTGASPKGFASNATASPTVTLTNPPSLGGVRGLTTKNKGSVASKAVSSAGTKPEEHAELNIPSGNAPPPSPGADQLPQLEHEIDLLASRAEAVDASLDGVRQTQSAQGLGLRGDIASSQQRMRTYMSKAQSALKNQDANGAKKYLGLAEPEVVSLEKFLGR